MYICLIPVLVGSSWVIYSDHIKELNVMADFITSNALKSWNFGSIEQKLSLRVWQRILLNTKLIIVLIITMLCFLIFLSRIRNYRLNEFFMQLGGILKDNKVLLMLLLFLIGPMIFTNLYFIHDYYFYANNLFLSLMIGLLFFSLLERVREERKFILCIIILPLLLGSSFLSYYKYYYPSQKHENRNIIPIAEAIKEYTPGNGISLIYGCDWNSSLPYYSQRKALMERNNLSLSDKRLQELIAGIGKAHFSVMVIDQNKDENFIKERVKYFGFLPEPIGFFDNFKLYVREDNITIKQIDESTYRNGKVEEVKSDNEKILVSGWAQDTMTDSPPKAIIFMDNNRTIVGKTLVGSSRKDIAEMLKNDEMLFSGWTLTMPKSTRGGKLSVYIVTKDNVAHLIKDTVEIP